MVERKGIESANNRLISMNNSLASFQSTPTATPCLRSAVLSGGSMPRVSSQSFDRECSPPLFRSVAARKLLRLRPIAGKGCRHHRSGIPKVTGSINDRPTPSWRGTGHLVLGAPEHWIAKRQTRHDIQDVRDGLALPSQLLPRDA